jgi:hypothetical protein
MKYSLFIDAVGELADELRFLGRAVSDDKTRYFIQNILVEYIDPEKPEKGLRGVATDRSRLHIVEPLNSEGPEMLGMTPGQYRYLKTSGKHTWVARIDDESVHEFGRFPNWRRVVPDGIPVFTMKYTGVQSSDRGHNSAALTKFLRAFPEATALNLTYLSDLGTAEQWDVEWTSSDKAIVFKAKTKTAVIMPIFVNDQRSNR